jgi:hypothetical protein
MILPSMPKFSSCPFHSGFPIIIVYAFLIIHIRATCAAHLILLDSITLIVPGEAYKLWSSSLCSVLRPPDTSSLFGSNILLSTLFPNILSHSGATVSFRSRKTHSLIPTWSLKRHFDNPEHAVTSPTSNNGGQPKRCASGKQNIWVRYIRRQSASVSFNSSPFFFIFSSFVLLFFFHFLFFSFFLLIIRVNIEMDLLQTDC